MRILGQNVPAYAAAAKFPFCAPRGEKTSHSSVCFICAYSCMYFVFYGTLCTPFSVEKAAFRVRRFLGGSRPGRAARPRSPQSSKSDILFIGNIIKRRPGNPELFSVPRGAPLGAAPGAAGGASGRFGKISRVPKESGGFFFPPARGGTKNASETILHFRRTKKKRPGDFIPRPFLKSGERGSPPQPAKTPARRSSHGAGGLKAPRTVGGAGKAAQKKPGRQTAPCSARWSMESLSDQSF